MPSASNCRRSPLISAAFSARVNKYPPNTAAGPFRSSSPKCGSWLARRMISSRTGRDIAISRCSAIVSRGKPQVADYSYPRAICTVPAADQTATFAPPAAAVWGDTGRRSRCSQ
jgi:hypothetical protein